MFIMDVYWLRTKGVQALLKEAKGKHWGFVEKAVGNVGVHSRGQRRGWDSMQDARGQEIQSTSTEGPWGPWQRGSLMLFYTR